jgi:DNA primase
MGSARLFRATRFGSATLEHERSTTMTISAGDLERIRKAADIVQLLSSHVHLVKIGATWRGACPFCKGTRPRFRVHVDRQIWHCFKCGAGGDVFKFFMDVDKVDFCTAVQNVATRLGFVLSLSNKG